MQYEAHYRDMREVRSQRGLWAWARPLGSRGSGPPKFGRTPNFLHSLLIIFIHRNKSLEKINETKNRIKCNYVTDCTKLGKPLYFL